MLQRNQLQQYSNVHVTIKCVITNKYAVYVGKNAYGKKHLRTKAFALVAAFFDPLFATEDFLYMT